MRDRLRVCIAMFVGFAVIQGGLAFAKGQGGGPPAGGPGAAAATVITKVEPNFTVPTAPTLTIHGEKLGTDPVVLLGDSLGTLTTLTVTAATDMLVEVELPPSIVPGTYMLVVQNGEGAQNTGIIDATIGAVGPQGPVGPVGPDGPEGSQGQEGPQGPQGPMGLPGASPWGLSGNDTFYNVGKVGIGTSSPQARLYVEESGASDIMVVDDLDSRREFRINQNGQIELVSVFGSNSALSFVLDTGTQERHTLTVKGDGSHLWRDNTGAYETGMFRIDGGLSVNAVSGAPGGRRFGIGTLAPSEALEVVGNILATGSITPGSSREFKENINALTEDEALDTLMALDAVKFNYKADRSGDLNLGFIAEDVPDLVSVPGRKGVSPMDIVAVLTVVVRQQQERIAALEAKLNDIQNR